MFGAAKGPGGGGIRMGRDSNSLARGADKTRISFRGVTWVPYFSSIHLCISFRPFPVATFQKGQK
jgi:hypothetical protein